jgi:hypothetical protein
MNLDEAMAAWRSGDLKPLYGVDQTRLHRALRQDQAKLAKLRRRVRWFMNVVNALLFLTAALFLAIMIDPKDDDVLIVWDYVIGVAGVAATLTLAGALSVTRRSQQALEYGFGDSLRDHLRRRIAQLDAEATSERRLALIIVAATSIGGWAISIAGHRINDVPWSEFDRGVFPLVLMSAFIGLVLFRWAPRGRRRNLARRRELEALLTELDGQ